ncbi:MAG: 30S ribosomal protein S8 [Actinomycetota bacterium]
MVKLSTNVTDPIADLLTRIRNANMSFKEELVVPASGKIEAVLRILEQEGYIESFGKAGEDEPRGLRVRLKYGKDRERTISGLERVSKPGRRVYAKRGEMTRVLGGLGVAIVSTSHGVMTDRDAVRKGVGGEVLAHVW